MEKPVAQGLPEALFAAWIRVRKHVSRTVGEKDSTNPPCHGGVGAPAVDAKVEPLHKVWFAESSRDPQRSHDFGNVALL